MKIKLTVDKRFDNLSLIEFYNYFYLGKQKIKEVKAYCNNKLISKDYILKLDDNLELEYDDEIDFIPENKKIDILYEDSNLLIVNKPKGILVHPDTKTGLGTLVNYVANYFKKNDINSSIRYLHRIDTDTTGIVLFAKNILTASYLDHEIALHNVKRRYIAFCNYLFTKKEGTIDLPIGRDRHNAKKFLVSKTGQVAITHYKVIKEINNRYSELLIELETGRTHQIRVHMSHIGHPLLGDYLYQGSMKKIDRQALHSYEVFLVEPISNKKIHVICPLPMDMERLLEEKNEAIRFRKKI